MLEVLILVQIEIVSVEAGSFGHLSHLRELFLQMNKLHEITSGIARTVDVVIN